MNLIADIIALPEAIGGLEGIVSKGVPALTGELVNNEFVNLLNGQLSDQEMLLSEEQLAILNNDALAQISLLMQGPNSDEQNISNNDILVNGKINEKLDLPVLTVVRPNQSNLSIDSQISPISRIDTALELLKPTINESANLNLAQSNTDRAIDLINTNTNVDSHKSVPEEILLSKVVQSETKESIQFVDSRPGNIDLALNDIWKSEEEKLVCDRTINQTVKHLNLKQVKLTSEMPPDTAPLMIGKSEINMKNGRKIVTQNPLRNTLNIPAVETNHNLANNAMPEDFVKEPDVLTVPKPLSELNNAFGRLTNSAIATEDLFDLSDIKISDNKAGMVSVIESHKMVYDKNGKKISPVRFIIPENLGQNGLKEKQTISIKMFPQHLGTVRLTLSSFQDAITGRIIVENVAAMTTVESNLNTLIDDLAERGIKLNSFEVTMAGDQTGQHPSQGQSPSSPRKNSRWFGMSDETESEMSISAANSINRNYAGADGVNLLV